MGNSASKSDVLKICKPPPKNEDSKYFANFTYTKDYFPEDTSALFLEYIDMKCEKIRSHLDSDSLNNISEILLGSENLKGLKLPLRNQDIDAINQISRSLLKLDSLLVLTLNLQYSKLNDIQMAGFLESLNRLVKMVDLDLNLSFSCFGIESMKALCNSILKFANLNELGLELEAVCVRESDFEPLLENIGELKNLCALSLRINESNIGDKGMKKLTDSLKKLEFLSGLELRINRNITDDGLSELFDTIIALPNKFIELKLHMNLNQFTNLSKLPLVIRSQRYLTEIQCSFRGVFREGNELDQEVFRAIEDSLYLFKHRILDFSLWKTDRFRKKEILVPILETITSELRRKKFRKEIVEEVVEILFPQKN